MFFYNTALFDKHVSLFILYAIRVGLNNAATSRILVNPAVILYFINNCKFEFLLIFVLMFNTFHRISLSCKNISLFKFIS